MQDFQSIPGLAGRLFGGAAAADIRRAQAQQGLPASRCVGFSQAPPEAVKCPRCESTNTKFCYYNNYNLSQPRHFCKSCRRYWTKGGVLRNVPVGGGCRKAKRSSSSSSSAAPSTPAATEAKSQRRASASSSGRSNSGSGSTSPAAAAAAETTTAPPAPATPSSNSNAISFANRSPNYPFVADVPPPAPIFADQAAALASLFAPPPPPPLPVFSFSSQPKKEEAIGSVLLPVQESEVPTSTSNVADMAPFMSLDTGMFDLGDASPAAYWNAGSCWTDVTDPSVYLP